MIEESSGAARLEQLPPRPAAGLPLPGAEVRVGAGAGRVLRLLIRVCGLTVLGGFAALIIGVGTLLLGPFLVEWLDQPGFEAWRTVLVAVAIQGMPFLLLGTVVSAAISAFVPARLLTRVLPANPVLAVPVAGAAGALLPGCECASVPVAAGLMRRGVAPAAALAFLLSAPAINPVVLVATSIAFPGRPEMVLARLLASLGASLAMGWLWLRLGRPEWLRLPPSPADDAEPGHRWDTFLSTLRHDFLHAGGFMVAGAAAAATFNIAVPPSLLQLFSAHPWLSVPLLGALAVVLSICSEADAFVAASLSGFSMTARLAFVVVGPTVDLKLIALQAGTFGWAFAARFSAATFVIGVLCSAVVGGWLL
ncbi:permease [Streptacidiphilus sp. EB129]|uniref:permease n=1 Tax=Streptacidiphilus sp. EB129 TaxID=3156262 RepID=UPI0035199521